MKKKNCVNVITLLCSPRRKKCFTIRIIGTYIEIGKREEEKNRRAAIHRYIGVLHAEAYYYITI